MRQCGPVVSLRSGVSRLKNRSDHSLPEFVAGSPWFNFPAALVNLQLVQLPPASWDS